MREKKTTMEYTEPRRKLILITPASTVFFNYTAFLSFLLQGRVPIGELQLSAFPQHFTSVLCN